jgi:hypothetical protein
LEIWKTPKPSCGISTPLFRVTRGTLSDIWTATM